jgi:SAM-dependent methyltransferase
MTEPNDIFDEYAEDYSKIMEAQLSGFSKDGHAYFIEYKIKILKRHFQGRQLNILDFGSGVGLAIPYLIKHFPDSHIHVTDPSTRSLQYISDKYDDVIVHQYDDFLKNRYDIILASGVFHHIHPTDRPQILNNLREALQEQGSLVVFEHNPYNPITRKLVRECEFDRDAVLIPRATLSQLLKHAGFTTEYGRYTLFIPPRFKGLLWADAFLGFLPFGGQYYVIAANNRER